jgi:hypothetical protein
MGHDPLVRSGLIDVPGPCHLYRGNRSSLKQLVVAVAAALIASASQAALVTGSLGGDGTVVDTVNNTEWLRLDLTRGQTIGLALGNFGGLGFTFATQAQLNGLLDEFFTINGGDPGTRAGGFVFDAATSAAAEGAWNALFGVTLDSGIRESLGFYDDGNPNTNETWFGFSSSPATVNATSSPPIFDIGVFLVVDRDANAVPEPSSLLLVAMAGLALVNVGRKARRG